MSEDSDVMKIDDDLSVMIESGILLLAEIIEIEDNGQIIVLALILEIDVITPITHEVVMPGEELA